MKKVFIKKIEGEKLTITVNASVTSTIVESAKATTVRAEILPVVEPQAVMAETKNILVNNGLSELAEVLPSKFEITEDYTPYKKGEYLAILSVYCEEDGIIIDIEVIKESDNTLFDADEIIIADENTPSDEDRENTPSVEDRENTPYNEDGENTFPEKNSAPTECPVVAEKSHNPDVFISQLTDEEKAFYKRDLDAYKKYGIKSVRGLNALRHIGFVPED